jgi:hypothetical protein
MLKYRYAAFHDDLPKCFKQYEARLYHEAIETTKLLVDHKAYASLCPSHQHRVCSQADRGWPGRRFDAALGQQLMQAIRWALSKTGNGEIRLPRRPFDTGYKFTPQGQRDIDELHSRRAGNNRSALGSGIIRPPTPTGGFVR